MLLQQGCQMVHFLTKNTNFATFEKALEQKIWVTFIAIWCTEWSFRILYIWSFGKLCGHLGNFVLCSFGILYQEKYGSPALETKDQSMHLKPPTYNAGVTR
jgi:hypothetical protein